MHVCAIIHSQNKPKKTRILAINVIYTTHRQAVFFFCVFHKFQLSQSLSFQDGSFYWLLKVFFPTSYQQSILLMLNQCQ